MTTLKQAVQLAREGQDEEALIILRQLVGKNEEDIYAWLWLAELSPDYKEAWHAVDRVLHHRPAHARALNIRDALERTAPEKWSKINSQQQDFSWWQRFINRFKR